jgi:predicted enzyme related to lactoylglutathione lyase
MVTRDKPWPAGTPCWVDLGVDDIGKAKQFYASLFGWEMQESPPEAGGYVLCAKDGAQVAGLGPKQGGPEVRPSWTTYIATEDADATVSKIRSAGGQLLVEPMDVMDIGRMAIAADPGGAVFGVWQARSHTGFTRASEPGTVCWSENMSRNFDANKAFYQAVFGYSYGDMSSDEMKYATLLLGDHSVGGIGEMGSQFPAEVPAYWGTYFAVDETDAAVAKVTELGGNVVAPPWDTPYGRMAAVADDQGAVFSVMSLRWAAEE